MEPLSSALSVLTAMITPAVLISACGTMLLLLISEARLALSTINAEMDFTWRLSQRHMPAEIVNQHKPHFVEFRRPRDGK
jgi:hypothetical protein